MSIAAANAAKNIFWRVSCRRHTATRLSDRSKNTRSNRVLDKSSTLRQVLTLFFWKEQGLTWRNGTHLYDASWCKHLLAEHWHHRQRLNNCELWTKVRLNSHLTLLAMPDIQYFLFWMFIFALNGNANFPSKERWSFVRWTRIVKVWNCPVLDLNCSALWTGSLLWTLFVLCL